MPTMITAFDKQTCHELGMELEALLQTFAKERGLVCEYAGSRFDPGEVKSSLRFTLPKGSEAALLAERRTFDLNCRYFGLKPEHYGTTIATARGPRTLIGFSSKGKYPIRLRDQSGLEWVHTLNVIDQLRSGK